MSRRTTWSLQDWVLLKEIMETDLPHAEGSSLKTLVENPNSCNPCSLERCPALSTALNRAFSYAFEKLTPWPDLQEVTRLALNRNSSGWSAYVVDPFTDILVIPLRQEHGSRYIWPLFQLSRSLIWCIHKEVSQFRSSKLI